MKALTVFQPWASLIIVGAKPFEFRKWNPREKGGATAALIGERLVIHASAKPIDRKDVQRLILRLEKEETSLLVEAAIPILERALRLTDAAGAPIGKHGDLPWGCGLGTAILGEPIRNEEIAGPAGLMRMNDSDRYDHALFGWPMLEVEAWDMPIEARGQQGLWNWPEWEDVI